jgi:hypothetical protein
MARRRQRAAEASAIPTAASADHPGTASPAAVALAIAWIAVPAVQHLGADQRMRLITDGQAPIPSLALMDWTVAYLLLVIATLIYVTLRFMRGRREDAPC